MHRSQQSTRRGTALIIAMALIVFVVVTSTYYVTSMGNYRGAGVKGSLELLADQAVEAGKAHAIRVLQSHALEDDISAVTASPTADQLEAARDVYSSFSSSWRGVFEADLSLEPAWLPRGYAGRIADAEPQENVAQAGVVITGTDTGLYAEIKDSLLAPFNTRWSGHNNALGESEHRMFNMRHGSRYFNVAWVDDDFQPVAETDATRRYKVRYAVMIFDLAARPGVNFLPEDAFPTTEPGSNEEVLDRNFDGTADHLGDGDPNTGGDLRRHFAHVRDVYATRALGGGKQFHLGYDGSYRTMGGVPVDPFALESPDRAWPASYVQQAVNYHLFFAPHPPGAWPNGASQKAFAEIDDPPVRMPGWSDKTWDSQVRKYQTDILGGKRHTGGRLHYQDLLSYYDRLAHGVTFQALNSDERGGHGVLMRHKTPGRKFSWEAVRNGTTEAGSPTMSAHSYLQKTPARETQSRQRGDDVDFGDYWNILTIRNSGVHRLLHDISSRLAESTEWTRPDHWNKDLLPAAEGEPLLWDDNLQPPHWDYTPSDPDGQDLEEWWRYFPGNYPGHRILARSEYGAYGSGVNFRDSWMERLRHMRRHFYGLTGAEGRGVGPFMSSPSNQGKLSDELRGPGNILDIQPRRWSGSIDQPDWPSFKVPAIAHVDRISTPLHLWDDYIWDVQEALALAVFSVRQAWAGSKNQLDSKHDAKRWEDLAAVRAQLADIHDVHRLFLEHLGERVAPAGASASVLGSPELWVAQPRVLAGRTIKYDWTNPGDDDHWQIKAIDFFSSPPKLFRIDQKHPKFTRVPLGANTAGMERLLNDVRMNFFGAWYIDETGTRQPIPPLDFNGDGFAESSYTGFNDGSIPPPPGSGAGGAYVHGVDRPRPLTADDGKNANWPFLVKHVGFPSKPWTVTGRFFMGKSHYYQVIVRGQVYDLLTEKQAAEIHEDFIYCVNPSDDPATVQVEDSDLSDSHIILQRRAINQDRDFTGGTTP